MRSVAAIAALLTAMLFTGCPGTAETTNTGTNENAANANAAKPAEDPSAAVKELETKAHEAWKAKDGKYFEGMLSDNFVGNGAYKDKAGLVKYISENPCEIKDVKLDDVRAIKLTDDAVIQTEKVAADFTCGGKPGLSPTWAASVFVKKDGAWKGAFHQSLPADGAKGEAAAAEFPASPADATDELTKGLAVMENKFWEEWKNKGLDYFKAETTDDYFSLASAGPVDKATSVKNATEQPCDVKSYKTGGFKAVEVSPGVAVVTYTATQEGSCQGKALPGKVFSTAIFVKTGEVWKSAFYMETPA